MAFGKNRARMEQELAKAHRALSYAADAADEMDDPGAHADIIQIRKEVLRVAEGSLRGRAKAKGFPGQMEFPQTRQGV